MTIPDINLLVYAYNTGAPNHVFARQWWEGLCQRREPIGLPWVVTCGFVRVMTHLNIMTNPMKPDTALACVRSWLERSHIQSLDPGLRHVEILTHLLDSVGVAGNLTSDAHLAAIAIEYQAVVHTNDMDFGRFPGLNWNNPLR
jgi:toxin-antitoxin system PIN domain toxin